MSKPQFCFVTEADLDRQGVGGVVTDKQVLRCLREFGDVEVIHLRRIRYRSTHLALIVFCIQILQSFSKPHRKIYFSRGLLTSLLLVTFNTLTCRHQKIVHRALSVPLGSQEVKFLGYGKVESCVRFVLFQFLEHILFPRMDFFVVAGEEYGAVLAGVGVERNRIHVLPFFVEDEFFNQPIRKASNKPFTFGYAGGFHFYHDMAPLIEAFRLFSEEAEDTQLALVGDGVSRSQVESDVRAKGLVDRVKFLGRISHSSMPRTLAQMDCFVLLTFASGLPIGLLEAAAAGKPIIAVKKKEDLTMNRLFEHGTAIFMVHSVSPYEIAASMKLLYGNSDLRDTIAQGARRVATQNFRKSIMRKQLKALIDNIYTP